MFKDEKGSRDVKGAGRAIAEGIIHAAILSLPDAPQDISSIPPGHLKWECAWHVQNFGKRAWYGDNHAPVLAAPDPLPQSHGLCLECFNKMEAEL